MKPTHTARQFVAHREFTDRDDAKAVFRAALDTVQPRDAYRVLHWYGVGGQGKSALLEEFERMARRAREEKQDAASPYRLAVARVSFETSRMRRPEEYIRGLKSASDAQQLLVLLHEEPHRSREDEKKYRAVVKAERAAERMQKAKAEVSRLLDAEKKAARKARDHELYNSAGLLIMAGLVETRTGKPLTDPAELLGALMGLAQVPADDPRREEWHQAGVRRMAERSDTRKTGTVEDAAS